MVRPSNLVVLLWYSFAAACRAEGSRYGGDRRTRPPCKPSPSRYRWPPQDKPPHCPCHSLSITRARAHKTSRRAAASPPNSCAAVSTGAASNRFATSATAKYAGAHHASAVNKRPCSRPHPAEARKRAGAVRMAPWVCVCWCVLRGAPRAGEWLAHTFCECFLSHAVKQQLPDVTRAALPRTGGYGRWWQSFHEGQHAGAEPARRA